jgi:FkbM family methyltransferase
LIGSGVALDVGANIGNHSVFFANYFNKVVSFEPHPKIFKLLKINTEDLANIEIKNFGLSDKSEASSLRYDIGNYGGSSLTMHNEKSAYQSVDVQVRPLDDELSNYDQPIVLIKIDVEGHEAEVLKGAKKVILGNKPTILFEQQVEEINDGTSETFEILKGYGYRFFSVENRYEGKSSKAAKIAAFIKAFIFGHCKVIVERKILENRHYEQLIAIHDGAL